MTIKMYEPTAKGVKLNLLIYGEPGTGKTTLAATAQDHPEMRDVVFLNIEGGLLSVVSRGEKIRAVDIRSQESLEEFFWELRKSETDTDSILYGVNTVVVDSGTELQTMILEALVNQGVEKAKSAGKVRSRDDIFLEDYGKATAALSRIFRWFRDLPVNFILTALPQPVMPPGNQENASPTEIRPMFTRKLGDKVMGYMDMVWYLYIDPADGERRLLTQQKGLFKAKTRGAEFAKVLPPVVGKQKNGESAVNLAFLYNLLQTSESPTTSPSAKPIAKKDPVTANG